ncbi:MAG: Sec-independent protein translocase protein TatB, partial [Gammaproteobacteria bacterium]|nr:Sec-independent protein translocase protein TatB [Gammaproteobacteria bacterium]
MFDVGFWELLLIFVVALIVVGPERMPGLIRTTGQWLGRAQRVARELRAEFEREAHTQEFKALNQQFQEEDRRLKEAAKSGASLPTPAEPPRKALADYTEEDFLPDDEDEMPEASARPAATTPVAVTAAPPA